MATELSPLANEVTEYLLTQVPDGLLGKVAAQMLFKCRQCGQCCHDESYVYVTTDDCAQMANLMGSCASDVIRVHTLPDPEGRPNGRILHSTRIGSENYCKFYDINTKCCMIYEARPLVCQLYPMLSYSKEQDINFFTNCKGTADLVEFLLSMAAKPEFQRSMEKNRADPSAVLTAKVMLFIQQHVIIGRAKKAKQIANLFSLKLPFDEKELQSVCLFAIMSMVDAKELEKYEYKGEENYGCREGRRT